MPGFSHVIYDVVQVVGSLFILTAFVLSLVGKLNPNGYRYLIVNVAGSAILTVTAVIALEWGFILLERVWAIASAVSIVRKATGRGVTGAH